MLFIHSGKTECTIDVTAFVMDKMFMCSHGGIERFLEHCFAPSYKVTIYRICSGWLKDDGNIKDTEK